MYQQTSGLRVAGAIFALVALVQLIRLLTGFDLAVAGHLVPLWANAIVFVIAASLSYWMFRLASRGVN